MGKDTRDLRHGEKRLAVFSSEKGRDRANAQRAIEGLSQNDQMIQLLHQQTQLLVEQTEMLRYMCDRLHAIESKTGAPSPSA